MWGAAVWGLIACDGIIVKLIVCNENGVCLFNVFSTVARDHYEWRGQIAHLAYFELVKQSRGTLLSWLWFFIKPAVYIFCFWFALEVGLRAGSAGAEGAPPYILWLCAGLIPWFFMQSMLGPGTDLYHRYPHLVSKMKFPLSVVPTIFVCSEMLIELMLVAALFVVYFVCGQGFDLYLLQIPLLLVLMLAFWYVATLLFSLLSGVSKDFANLMKALMTPFFWLSGILFNAKTIGVSWIQNVLYFDPISFFATGFRDALYDKVWIWEDPMLIGCFAGVFVFTVLSAAFVYGRLHKEIVDVL